MQKKFPIKLILITLIVLFGLWWLWPATDPEAGSIATALDESEQGFVSAIQPIEAADANAIAAPATDWTSSAKVSPASGAEIRNSFDEALQSLNQGDDTAAIGELDALIKKHPQHVEPYINLASIYAGKGQLEQARKTLLSGLNADESYATLFTNLQKINGALAANAYQAALAEEGEAISEVKLPLLDVIDLSPDNQRAVDAAQEEIESYKSRLTVADSELRQLTDKLTETEQQLQLAMVNMDANVEQSSSMQTRVSALQTQLQQAQQNKVTLQDEHKSQVALLQQQVNGQLVLANNQQQIDEYKALVDKSETAIQTLQSELADSQQQSSLTQNLADANAQKASSAQQDMAALQNQLAQAQQRITALRNGYQLEVAGLQSKLRQLEEQQALAANQQRPVVVAAVQSKIPTENGPPVAQGSNKSADIQEQQAIALVSSWADAWSAQLVSDYIAHYVDGYAPPGSGMNNAAWIEQRRIRLTNKPFIEVKISNYQVERVETQAGEDRFSVTFLQHYRTNTLDDKIRKRLLFSVAGSDWSQAKIIEEKVLR